MDFWLSTKLWNSRRNVPYEGWQIKNLQTNDFTVY